MIDILIFILANLVLAVFARGKMKQILVIFIILSSQAAVAQSALIWDFLAAKKEKSIREVEPDRFASGTVNGVKLRIPVYYLHYGVVYEGGERDGLGPASASAAQDSRIDNFGILLRLSTFQPIRTEQDRREWQEAFAHTDFEKTWLMVSFDSHYPPLRAPLRHMDYMIPHWGPYDRDKKLLYGLVHYDSTQSVEESKTNGDLHRHVEYFFDDTSPTVIICQTTRMVVPPFTPHDFCEHHFLVPDLNLMAEAFYTKKDLPRWSEIENRVKSIAHSFVVK